MLSCFHGSLIFTTATFYQIYSEKYPVSLIAVFCGFATGSALPTHSRYNLGDLPFGHVLVLNMLSELSEVGLVKSCLEKEGSSLPQVTEEQNVVILTENEMDLLPLSRHRGCYDW